MASVPLLLLQELTPNSCRSARGRRQRAQEPYHMELRAAYTTDLCTQPRCWMEPTTGSLLGSASLWEDDFGGRAIRHAPLEREGRDSTLHLTDDPPDRASILHH